MKNLFKTVLLTAALGVSAQAYAVDPVSIKLTDTIDKGIGNINLFKNVTGPQLELFRLNNDGLLSFGVDVNEAANGTEKASAQAVTVQSASLVVTFSNGTTKTYSSYYTETQTLVALAGQTTRLPYYTLLGESGSSRISSINSIQAAFDSTLKVRVTDSLTTATNAVLAVRFVDTNSKLGDPEAFYDFTAGFEDLALLNKPDTTYVDVVLPTESTFRTESPLVELSPEGEVTAQGGLPPPPEPVTKVHFPSANTYQFVAFEDLFPQKGDYDYNDVVVAFRTHLTLNSSGLVTQLDGEAYLLARGAIRTHDFTLRIDVPTLTTAGNTATCQTLKASQEVVACNISDAVGSVTWAPFQDTRAIFPQAGTTDGGLVNTQNRQDYQLGPKANFSVKFATPIAVPPQFAAEATYAPSIFVRDSSQTVDLANRDENNWPFAAMFPNGWSWPLERVDTGDAYPELINFVTSGASLSTDWYTRPVNTQVVSPRQAKWEW